MNAATPPAAARRWSDARVERLLGNLLRGGVLVAAAIVFLGGIVFVAQYGGAASGHHVFAGEPARLRSIRGIIGGALHLDGASIIQLGLVTLIATPVARVAFSLIAFALQRDRMYVVITAIVLGLLLFSLSGG